MRWYGLALGVLGVWRITHLLHAEDGPANLLARFRRWVGAGFWGSLLDCFYCLSLWVAVPFALIISRDWSERLLLWLAFSAGAILLERVSTRVPEAIYHEDEENENVVLRKNQESVSERLSDDTGR